MKGGRDQSRGASEMDSIEEVNSVFEALSNERRRFILYYLLQSEGQATVTELVDFVAEKAPEANPEESEPIAIDLSHCQLPKLHDLDMIKYDSQDETVRYRERPLVETCLTHVEDRGVV